MTVSSTSTAASRSATLSGIGLMLLGVFLFCINDAVGKWLVATYPVGQFLLIRSATTLILLAPFIWRAGRAAFASAPRPGLQVLRVVLSVLEVALFFWAVVYLPLADAITFYLAGPIYVTALSAVLLHERVGWRRWIAVLAGFLGVLIALRPSAATLTLPALIALGGSICFALLMIVTRMLRDTHDTVLMSSQMFGTFAFGAVAAPLAWVTPSLYDLMFLCGFGAVSVAALFSINRSLKLAPASVVVPYQYTMLVWAILFGYIGFDDVPDRFMLLGSAIIVAAGLYIFHREQIVAHRDPVLAPPP
jgi:drug/metabolite transporter (DMT)-like permease